MKSKLEKARALEKKYLSELESSDRPQFHVTGTLGWINDPNGFSLYKGEYHLFFQYYPYDIQWGPMHWGHVKTTDFIHWEHLPCAMAPDQPFDKSGCFSGSAIELPDGRHLLLYTGVVNEGRNPRTMKITQHQCIAVGDGINYEKYNDNPVLDSKDIPEGCHKEDFRDPKIWQEADGTYRCVVGVRPADKSGMILLYSSPDAFHWKFESILDENRNRFGKMWECPDFFELDGKYVLLTSPQDMLPEGFEYHNGNGSLCLIGSFDEETKKFYEEYNQSVDYGIDFYASQTLLTPDGRRVMIAWMQNWDTLSIVRNESLWFGQMTLPREIRIKNNRLYQWPVREIELLQHDKVEYHNVLVDGELVLEGIKGRILDMIITIRPADGENVYNKFAVWFALNDIYHTSLSFHPSDSIMKIDRKHSGSRRAVIHQRRSKVNHENGALTFRMILDRFSAEFFINNGEQTITATVYTDQAADGIRFISEGKVLMDIEKYDLTQGIEI